MTFQDFQNAVNEARAASEAARLALKNARHKTENIQRQKGERLREIPIDARDNDRRLAILNREEAVNAEIVKSNQRTYAEALRAEWSHLQERLRFTDPITNIGSLDDSCPILLLPLRLETRFKKVVQDDRVIDQLWVRVFPDDIAINTFESDLSETEIRNTKSYWVARWNAGQQIEGNKGAWRSLAAAHGPGRAFWLTNNYAPLNRSEEPTKDEGEIILAIGTEDPLTDPELSAIRTYWEAVWRANGDPARLTAAWNTLLTVISAERAETLVKDYKPINLSASPPEGLTHDETSVRVLFVIFPKTDDIETKLHAWSQPPTTSILPERLVFMAFQGETLDISPQLGNLIPPKLVLGPDPAADQGEDFRLATSADAEADPTLQEGDLIFADHLRWLFDFEDAVAKGMGFRINLTPEQASQGFDRVFVLGLKLSASQEKGQQLLEELFAQHQNSRKGLGIVRQGTPTNNTEDESAGYSWRHDPDDSFSIYFDPAADNNDPLGWYEKRDGRWLADMLGIDPAVLQTVENYYGTDIAEGKAMQRALWSATLGHFMDSMMNPIFSPTVIEQTRQFFTRYVSGRGSLPIIQVGKQPYGIVPATPYTKMDWVRRQSSGMNLALAQRNNFLPALYQILMDMDRTWMILHRQAAYVGKTGDAQQILLDIIGLHPDSVEVYKRYANSIKQVHNIYNAKAFPHSDLFILFSESYAAAAALLARYGYTITDDDAVPEIFKKAFFKTSYFLGGDRIDKVPNSETEEISVYTADDKNYISWLIEAAETSHDRLRLQDGFVDDQPPTALLYLLLYHALDLSYVDTSIKLHRDILTDVQMRQAYIEPDFIHVEEEKETESRWKYLYKPVTDRDDLLIGQYIAEQLGLLDEAAALRDALAGLRLLEHVPTARLERAMMEHIDTVSYRYDAWILGYVHVQLEHMRGLSNDETRRGIYLGAYGWLEDLRPENKDLRPVRRLPDELNAVFNAQGDLVEDPTNAGYILAPSQNHAVTAAVLRNGHLSNEEPEEKEDLKIKLSSERVRRALQIIEGIQNGQTLPALLGYQFERELHNRSDAEVDGFIFDLREKFPLASKNFKETTPDASDPDYESIDQIEARNVINGVAFLEHIYKTGKKTYPFGLSLPSADSNQKIAINQEVERLIELNDAVADLALAESVHQAVLGNYERSAATLDTYSKGNFPPTPDVIQTPRSGIQLNHRVALLLETGLSHDLSTPGVTPRMVSEPAIHAWLSQIMPDLAEITCMVGFVNAVGLDDEQPVTMSQLGLSHIDLLYLLNLDQGLSALDDLITHHAVTNFAPSLSHPIIIEYTRKDDHFSVFEITSLVASLRALLLKSRPLTAADIKVANEAAQDSQPRVSLNHNRVQPLITALTDLRSTRLADYIADLDAVLATDNVDDIVNALDGIMTEFVSIFLAAGRYGLPQTGIGFVYQWQQSLYTQLMTKLAELIARWEQQHIAFTDLRDAYHDGVTNGFSDDKLFAILRQAELKISSTATTSLPASPAAYLADLETGALNAFEDMFNNTMLPMQDIDDLRTLIQSLQALRAQIAPFDIIGLDIDEQLKQIGIFADGLRSRAANLSTDMEQRETKAGDFLAEATVDSVKQAAQTILGGDFVMVPEFTLESMHSTEWQNTLTDSDHSLRYLMNDLDFPMDDWLYGVGRVREKLYHLENTLIHIEGFTNATFSLVPAQFPYREDDYWLGMQFPEQITIDENKLLFTAIYPSGFVPTGALSGLVLDEWTEIIPSRDETLGLTFHYDQPNSEPPQALLLVTPSNFTGKWRWDDLVNTLHETLDMARKRAVEPDHIDGTVYSRFLPPIVSLASPFPLTATLNLAINNRVLFTKAFDNE